MANDTAKTITTNIVPVQGTFEPLPPYECINLIGPAGTPFFAPTNPNLDGVNITNSTINSTTIGATTPSTAAFTTATGSNAPVGNLDLTNKVYVDSAIVGISWKQPVVAGTLSTNITLSGAQSIDGVSVVAGERVLVKNQTDQSQNGIYVAATGAWSRAPDADTWDDLVSALVFIESGTQAGTAWYCPIQPGGTLGTTAITWSNFSIAGTYYAGTGLTLTANTFSITNTGVAAATYGSASTVPTIAVNAQGQITSATNTNIAIAASAITSGTIDSARISGSYSGITTVGTLTGLTVSSTITGSISGNAATATSATTAASATSLIGGAAGSIPYQSSPGATTFIAAGSNGQVLTLASGVPSWSTPTTGTVTSVGTAGTVNGLTLTGGPITGSGTVTLGGTLDLSAPPTIGNTTANTGAFTTLTASSSLTTPAVQATNSGGLALKNSVGTTQISMGAGVGDNVSVNVSANLNGTNAQIDISPTGTGHVHIKPTGSGSLEIAPTSVGTINNMTIGATTAAAAKVTTLDITSTLALNGSTGTAGYVLTSNGASAPTWNANANGVTITDDTTTNATRYLTFSELTAGTETTLDVSSTKLQFNPSTGFVSSTGLITGAGTVSAPALTTTGDTNTGIFFPAADTIAFTEGGAESMRIDASGRVGIGTTSPSAQLDVRGSSPYMYIVDSGANLATFVAEVTNTVVNVGSTYLGTSAVPLALVTGGTERMRIDSSGNLLVATTTVRNSGIVSVDFNGNTAGALGLNDTASLNGAVYAGFLSGGTFRGSITNNNNTAVAYNTTSDYRLKENIAPMTGALDKVAQLKPCTYTWKETGSSSQGFIAHELAEVCPDAVTGEKDAINRDGSIKPQGVDTSFLVATLTAAIQELKAELDATKAEVQALKGVA